MPDIMESTRLLLPSETKSKKAKWGGRIIKRLFRRDGSNKQGKSKYQHHHSAAFAESVGGEESIANQYFATLKESSVSSGIEELDHTTVNLSFSAGSNPYSTDDSYDTDNRASWRRAIPVKQQQTFNANVSEANNGKSYRSSDISFSSDPTATSTSVHNNNESYGNTESSFVQLDVPKMQRASSLKNGRAGTPVRRNVDDDFDDTSFPSETGIFDNYDAIPFVFHTRSSTSRVLEETCPTMGSLAIVSDHGMEVVLFDSNNNEIDLDLAEDNEENDIFMSFKFSSVENDDEWRDPFNADGMKVVFPDITSKTTTPQRKFSVEFEHGDDKVGDVHYDIPPSPAVSMRSETSVTWVSHDDDDADERPMKEILVPMVDDIISDDENDTSPPVDDVMIDHDSINEIAVESIIMESLLTPRSVSNTIFASTPVLDEKQTAGNTFAAAAVTFPFFWNSPNNVTSVRSAFTPKSVPIIVTTLQQQQQEYRLSPRRVQSVTVPNKEPVSNFDESFEMDGKGPFPVSPRLPSPSILPKAPSSAFLKRKSVFMGEDLLTQEAESFVEFLEDHDPPNIALDIQHKFSSTTPISDANLSPNTADKNSIQHSTSVSAAERLLFAMTESVDNSETDGDDDQDSNNDAAIVEAAIPNVEITAMMTSANNLIFPQNGVVTPVSESVDMSYAGYATLQSLATSRTGSTGIFSKSLSDEDADDEDEEEEELTNNASESYASSCTSYAPSTLQGSRSGRIKYTRSSGSINGGIAQLPYCGVFIQEDIGEDDEEEEYEEDDLSLPSEDFSVRRRGGMNIRHYISSSSSRHGSSRSNGNDSREGTALLDQVRSELLETVQDLAREGSSAVMNFLRPRP